MHTLSVPVLAGMIATALFSFSRVLDKTKPAWGLAPGWLQVLFPSLLTAAGVVIAALQGVKTPTDLTVAIVAGIMAILPGLPTHRSNAPLPRNNSSSGGGTLVAGATALLIAIFAFHVSACTWFTHTLTPALKHCEPSATALVSQAESILVAGGDYEKQFADLAVQVGQDVLDCAIATAINLLASKVGTAEGSADGVARGKAYLAKHPQ
jgi:hypothetical protein